MPPNIKVNYLDPLTKGKGLESRPMAQMVASSTPVTRTHMSRCVRLCLSCSNPTRSMQPKPNDNALETPPAN